ncbi:hypothetical protein ACROYT_G013835 [Oculina patagonica]
MLRASESQSQLVRIIQWVTTFKKASVKIVFKKVTKSTAPGISGSTTSGSTATASTDAGKMPKKVAKKTNPQGLQPLPPTTPPPPEESMSLLQWLRCHSNHPTKPKAYGEDKYLVAFKYVSVFHPVYFYQHLAVNHPHRSAEQLHHQEEESMPVNVKYFAQAVRLQPDEWSNAQQILEHFK